MQSIQAGTRVPRTDIRARIGEDTVHGHALFQWMLRHAAWAHNRFQPHSQGGGNALGNQNGYVLHKSSTSFHGACVIRVPIDFAGLRRKLDVQWMTGIWVGRVDESDGHVVLTPHGTVTGRSVRRLAGSPRGQPRSGGKGHKSCSRSNFLPGRTSESAACICADQAGR